MNKSKCIIFVKCPIPIQIPYQIGILFCLLFSDYTYLMMIIIFMMSLADMFDDIKSLFIPIFYSMDGYFCTFLDQLSIFLIQKFRQIFEVFRLASHSCKCLMSYNIFLLLIFKTLSNKFLKSITSYLTDNKTHLMFKQAGLSLEVLLREKFA